MVHIIYKKDRENFISEFNSYLDKRPDGFLLIISPDDTYKNEQKGEAALDQFADKLAYVPYKGIPTWPLFNKKETELAAAYDKAVQTLKENGTISALSLKYFGEDVFNFVTE